MARTITDEEIRKRAEEQARIGGIPGIERGLLEPKPVVPELPKIDLSTLPPKPEPAPTGGAGRGEDVPPPTTIFGKYKDFTTYEDPSGKKLLFRDPQEARTFAERQIASTTPPVGTISPQELEQQQKLQELLMGLGLTPEEQQAAMANLQEAPTNWSQALTAGTVKAAPSAITGAVGAAFLGAKGGALAGPWGIAAGAIGGFAYGLYQGAMANMEVQKRGEIKAGMNQLSNSGKLMRAMAMAASMDPGRADMYLAAYDQHLALAWQAYGQIKVETQGDLNAYIEDGRDELSQYAMFLEPGGGADIYKWKLEASIATGQPLMVIGDELEFMPKQ